MITKDIRVDLTSEEIHNADPIRVIVRLHDIEKNEELVSYTVDIPKGEDSNTTGT